MNLAENWSEGSEYLPAGEHVVRVKMHRMFTANSGNDGVEFEVFDEARRTGKTGGFYLTAKALWKLSSFVHACGLEQEECRDYDPSLPQSHTRLHNRKLCVTVTMEQGNDGKEYGRVTAWRRYEDNSVQPHQPPPGDMMPQKETPGIPEPIPEDDIPF